MLQPNIEITVRNKCGKEYCNSTYIVPTDNCLSVPLTLCSLSDCSPFSVC